MKITGYLDTRMQSDQFEEAIRAQTHAHVSVAFDYNDEF
jgi:hypothetical protein